MLTQRSAPDPKYKLNISSFLTLPRKQGMLTQGPTPYPKCKVNISLFLTLPHQSDCLICAKDIMIIVLLQMMGQWEGWGLIHLC